MSELIGLKEFNDKKNAETLDQDKYPRPNGIACPNCTDELMDSDAMILTSYPPKKHIHCPTCNYHGYRNA